MAGTGVTNAQLLERFDALQKTLTENYISRRELEQMLKSIVEQQGDLAGRLKAIEDVQRIGTQWANDEHSKLLDKMVTSLQGSEQRITSKFEGANQRRMGTVAQILITSGGVLLGSILSLVGAILVLHLHP